MRGPTREIIVVPTTHHDEGVYTAGALAALLVSLAPEVVSLARGPEAEKLRRLHAASARFHGKTREGAIAANCLRAMEGRERGVLLIGAEHLGIVGGMRRACRGSGMAARWVRASEALRPGVRVTPLQRPDQRI